MEDDDALIKTHNESVLEAASTWGIQTAIKNDTRYKVKFQDTSNHISVLDDFRSRLRHPSQYVRSLQELEEKVWGDSTISMYGSWNAEHPSSCLYKKIYGPEDFIPYPKIPSELQDVIPNRLSNDPFAKDPTNTSDEEITAICQSAADQTSSSHLNAIRMCRNVMLRTFLNLKSLQESNFCAGSFSIVVLDVARPNVARLLPIEIADFIALVYELEYILRDCASLVLSANGSEIQLNTDRQFDLLSTPMVNKYFIGLLGLIPGHVHLFNLGVVSTFSGHFCSL